MAQSPVQSMKQGNKKSSGVVVRDKGKRNWKYLKKEGRQYYRRGLHINKEVIIIIRLPDASYVNLKDGGS